MSNLGYLYILANSAMPGLIKIGKTTRTPSERAQELSSVTGLPTPFIVVYEQLFEDCSAAEIFVHTILSQMGFRVSENREFFNAPANEAVRAIVSTPGAITADIAAGNSPSSDEKNPEISDVGDTEEGTATSTFPFTTLLEEARAYYLGEGDYLQDFVQSLGLFHQAVKLGSLFAYQMIGHMHQYGEGTPKDRRMAHKYYEEGARRGNAQCYWAMGKLFMLEKHYQNADKCFSKFTERFELDAENTEEKIIFFGEVINDCHLFLLFKTSLDYDTTPTLDKLIQANRTELLEKAHEEYQRNSTDKYRLAIKYLEVLQDFCP